MSSFSEFLKTLDCQICPNSAGFCSAGQTFHMQGEDFDGCYWYYETDQFIVDIHDFFITKEKIVGSFSGLSHLFSFNSTYIKSANGECFTPYQTLTSNTLLVSSTEETSARFLLHGNSPFLSVGISFKENMIQEYLASSDIPASDVFFDTRELVTKPLELLANAILTCQMTVPAAQLFFEAKAKEWLSITLDAYLNKSRLRQISAADKRGLENVENYINDHYALDIPQELLEKIAMMSGTKLKTLFSLKNQMSITEYSQRKRMNIAETLLSTTDLEIKDIAKSVGYASHSRFTTLFKKYKGIYPREVKKQSFASHPAADCHKHSCRRTFPDPTGSLPL